MKKDIIFRNDALVRLAQGVKILEETVGGTLGPGGRNVIFDNYGYPLVTKDGVTVANQIELADKWQNVGVQMVKRVANVTCNDAGDGTTTATVLANAILQRGVQALFTSQNPINVQRGIMKAVDVATDYMHKNIRIDISKNPEKVRDVALLSANWDEEIGNAVADAILSVGVDGSIDIENADSTKTSVNYINGVKFDRGFINPALAQNAASQKTVFEKPFILLVRGEFNFTTEAVSLYEQILKNNASLVIVADGFGSDALSMMVANKTQAKLNITALKAPHYRDMRVNTMEDLATMFGTEYFDFNFGSMSIEDIVLEDLGSCDRVVQTGLSTTFIGGHGDEFAVKELVEEIKALANDPETTELVRGNAELRIKQIVSKAAIIRVGSSTEVENNEKRDRIDDAVHATRAALEDGIVPGGSYCYIKATNSKEMKELYDSTEDASEKVGVKIVMEALDAPFERLMKNAGLEKEQWMIYHKINESSEANYGFDVKKQEMCNLIERGVVDPWMVTKSALRNAASVTGLILTAHAVVIPSEELPVVREVRPSIPCL